MPARSSLRALSLLGGCLFAVACSSAKHPDAPTGVHATAGNAQATVTWTAPVTHGSAITGYTLYSNPGQQVINTNATTATFTGLFNGTSYTFTVFAHSAAGNGPESGPSNAVTPSTLPSAPTDVTATAGNAQAVVTWTAPDDGGNPITGYTVTTMPGGTTTAATATSATITGLTNGTTYTFTVHATTSLGNSPESAPSNPVTPSTVPSAPTNVQATPGIDQATVSWTASADDGGSPVTGYTVTASPGGATVNATEASSVAFPGLTGGTSYTFTVHATNMNGNGPESAPSPAVSVLAPIAVSFAAPATMAHVLPKFQVQIDAAFTGSSDSLTLSAPGLSAMPLTPAASVTATFDASSLPDGPLTLTATLTEGTQTATATLNVVIDRALLTPVLAPVTGFYKLTDPVPLSATFGSGGTPTQVVFSAGTTTVQTVSSATNGAWSASVPAMNVGRGDVTITATATDALGNTGTATSGTFTIGLLKDTACAMCGGQLQLDVVTPSGDGMLYAARIDTTAAGTVNGSTNLGDLRFTGFGGGSTVTLASRVCFHTDQMTNTGEGSDVILSADGSHVMFLTAPPAAPGSMVPPTCTQLEVSAIPPGPNDPQIVESNDTVGLDTRSDGFSTDGKVVMWTPDGNTLSGGVVGDAAHEPAPLPMNLPVTGAKGPLFLPLNGGLLMVDFHDGTSWVLNAQGASQIQTGAAGSMVPIHSAPVLRWSPFGVPAADGSSALIEGSDRKTLYALNVASATATAICAPPGCSVSPNSDEAAPVLALRGGVFFFEAVDSNGNAEVGVYDASTGAAPTFIANARFAPNGSTRARDASTVPLMVPAADGASGLVDVVLASADGTTTPIAPDLNPATTRVHFINYDSNWWWGGAPYLFRSYFDPFDDATHCFAYDTSKQYADVIGSSAVPVAAGATTPFETGTLGQTNSGGITFLPGRQTAIFETGATDIYEPSPGQLWAYTFGQPQGVQLIAPGLDPSTPLYLPFGDRGYDANTNWLVAAGPAMDLRSAQHVAFGAASPSDSTKLQVFVEAIDGSGGRLVTAADDSDDATVDRRFGVTADDATVWWYAFGGHLYAEPLAGGAKVDLGAVEPADIVSLPGGVFFATQSVAGSPLHQMVVTSLARPVPQPIGMPMTNYPEVQTTFAGGIATNDDQTSLYVVNQIDQSAGAVAQPSFLINAQGVTQVTADSAQFLLDYDAGFGFARGNQGELWVLDQHTGGTAVEVEAPNGEAPVMYAGTGAATRGNGSPLWQGASVPGHARPTAAGQLPWGGAGSGEDDFFYGAKDRFAVTYVAGGTTRPGVYVYDTVDGIVGDNN